LDINTLKKFLDKAADHLTGDWLLMGGTVLPLLDQEVRATTDIDIVRVGGKGRNEDTLQLMELAESIGLPPESINQAGAFFLSKIEHGKKDLVLLRKGKKSRIFRPGATLFILLKIGRMSQSDFADCRAWLGYCARKKEPIDRERVEKAIQDSMAEASEEKKKGLLTVRQLLPP
jgi:hypothetical protein